MFDILLDILYETIILTSIFVLFVSAALSIGHEIALLGDDDTYDTDRITTKSHGL